MMYVYIECNLILGGSSVRIDMSYLITVAYMYVKSFKHSTGCLK